MDYRMTGWLLQTLLWVFLLIIDTLFPKSLKFGNSYHSLSPHEVEWPKTSTLWRQGINRSPRFAEQQIRVSFLSVVWQVKRAIQMIYIFVSPSSWTLSITSIWKRPSSKSTSYVYLEAASGFQISSLKMKKLQRFIKWSQKVSCLKN